MGSGVGGNGIILVTLGGRLVEVMWKVTVPGAGPGRGLGRGQSMALLVAACFFIFFAGYCFARYWLLFTGYWYLVTCQHTIYYLLFTIYYPLVFIIKRYTSCG